MSSGRKRVVSSCVPCYTRKQKCNRQFPCNNCARRRCPEDCTYYPPAANSISKYPPPGKVEARSNGERSVSCVSLSSKSGIGWSTPVTSKVPTFPVSTSSSQLLELFGYFEDSDSNTLALIRKLGVDAYDNSSPALPTDEANEINRLVEQMPDRQIIDFLIRYFVAEINWIDHLIYAPWFLTRYQRWWAMERVTLAIEVDFAVLILRICSYASQFLPSPTYTLDKIQGVLLSDIRNSCDEVAESLSATRSSCGGRGSLFQVQHLAFFGLRCQMEGRRDKFCDAISRALRVAHSVGLHSEMARMRQGVDEVEKEMGRRTFCNLYIWDSLLSRQFDRVALLPGYLNASNWPKMHVDEVRDGPDGNVDGSSRDAPEPFAERILQARLADFWRRLGPKPGVEYDMMIAEERYEQFSREYLAELPPAFALQPTETWDKRLPKLPMQRQLLHISIYESLCWNFRPLLLQMNQEEILPAYKHILLESQKRALAVSALRLLDSLSQLHALLGGCHTRFAALVFSTFEAAVLLVYLGMDPLFLAEDHPHTMSTSKPNDKNPDPLRLDTGNVSRQGCKEAVQGALDRLRMLAEVSFMAEVEANTLTQILDKAAMTTATDEGPVQSQDCGDDLLTFDPLNMSSQDGSSSSHVLTPVSIEDMSHWSFFDPSNFNAHGDLVPSSTAQGFEGDWLAPTESSN